MKPGLLVPCSPNKRLILSRRGTQAGGWHGALLKGPSLHPRGLWEQLQAVRACPQDHMHCSHCLAKPSSPPSPVPSRSLLPCLFLWEGFLDSSPCPAASTQGLCTGYGHGSVGGLSPV